MQVCGSAANSATLEATPQGPTAIHGRFPPQAVLGPCLSMGLVEAAELDSLLPRPRTGLAGGEKFC